MFWIRRFFLKLQSELTKPNTSQAVSFNLNRPQTGSPCDHTDRACNSNIIADHYYSVSAKKSIELWSSDQQPIIFNFKANFGEIYSVVIVLQGKDRQLHQSGRWTSLYSVQWSMICSEALKQIKADKILIYCTCDISVQPYSDHILRI